MNRFSVVGNKALNEDNNVRTATVKCMDEGKTACLTLKKEDYKKLVLRQIIINKYQSFEFMVKCVPELFIQWNKSKIMDMNDSVEEIMCEKG